MKVAIKKTQTEQFDDKLDKKPTIAEQKSEIKLPTQKRPAVNNLGRLTIMIYGERKIGKSSTASEFPEPIFLSGEEGTKGFDAYTISIDNSKGKGIGWKSFRKAVKLLRTEPHDYKTVVVDTIDPIYDYCLEYVCEDQGMNHPSDEGYGKGWKAVEKEFVDGIDELLKLGLGVIFISHATEAEFLERTGKKYNKLISSMPGQCRKFISAQCDIIIYYGYYGNRRLMTVRGSDTVESGHRLRNHFWIKGGREAFKEEVKKYEGKELTEEDEEEIEEISFKYRVHSIPCGADEEQAYANLVKAFNNEQISSYAPEDAAVLTDRKAKMESKKKTGK